MPRGKLSILLTIVAVGFVLALGLLPVAAGTPLPFTEEAVGRGLDFTMSPYPQLQGYVGQGTGFVDLDSDGDPDVVAIGRADGVVGIFENTGSGIFIDRSVGTGIPILQEQEGVSAADYDADGFIDIFITQAINRPNYLLKNNGNFTFTDVTGSSGTSGGIANSTGSAWGDYNNDGWPDLYVCNYAQLNVLYRNNANGTFTNVGPGLGVTGGSVALSFQVIWTDYDRDGDSDLYLSNDRGPLGFPNNFLWRNDGGTFTDVSATSGAGISIYSMGLGAGDIDNNGYTDYYFTNVNSFESNGGGVMYDGINPLMLNQGDGTLVDQTELWETDNRITSWAAIFFDYDNDGRQDIYVNNQFEPNSFFECEGVPPCTEMAQQLGIEAVYDPDYDFDEDLPEYVSYTSAVADVDGDGDQDLAVNNVGYRAELFINNEGNLRNSVRYRIVGEHPNLFALGAGVETTVGGLTQFHEVYAGGNGYLGQNELTVHVGLGDATRADLSSFVWPGNGPTRVLTDLPANETWTIYPPSRLCDFDGDGIDYDDLEEFSGCFVSGFVPGCEMMDFDGDSDVYVDDLEDCFLTDPADCNANGTQDLVEIMIDLDLDTDQNLEIDCCEAGPATDPNPVGNTLLLNKNPSEEPVLTWTAPGSDPTHDPATGYDVFRSVTVPFDAFGLLGSPAGTTLTDSDASPQLAFYLVGARNGCGTSGEEPF